MLGGAGHVHVLDPSGLDGRDRPEPEGSTISRLVAAPGSSSGPDVVGAGLTEDGGTTEQVGVLSPVIATIEELLQPRSS